MAVHLEIGLVASAAASNFANFSFMSGQCTSISDSKYFLGSVFVSTNFQKNSHSALATLNGTAPVRITYTVTPRAQTSNFSALINPFTDSFDPSKYSGEQYESDPIAPHWTRVSFRANPKSASLGVLSLLRKMF